VTSGTGMRSGSGMYQQIARNKRLSIAYVLAFFVVWLGIGAGVGWLWAVLSAGTSTDPGPSVVTGAVVASLLALAGIAFSLGVGARMVLRLSGARPADPLQYPQVHHLVQALALGDGLPTPAIYVVDDPSPNAFATGTSPAHAAVTVTTGLLETMDREELEGVLAHELSHIKNYDVRLLLIVSTLIGMAGLLSGVAWRSTFFTRSRGRNGGQAMIVVLAAGALLSLVAFVLGPVVRLALSRRRESLADVSGVELTRNPVGLIRALQRLRDDDAPPPRSLHAAAAMCIDDPGRHQAGGIQRLYDTHPTLDARIAALQQIARGTGPG